MNHDYTTYIHSKYEYEYYLIQLNVLYFEHCQGNGT